MTVLEVLDVGMTSPLNGEEERSTPILVEGFIF